MALEITFGSGASMTAIALSTQNIETILEAGTSVTREDLENLVVSTGHWGHVYYFLPSYVSADGTIRDEQWGAFPQDFMDAMFEFDQKKITGEFTEIKHKTDGKMTTEVERFALGVIKSDLIDTNDVIEYAAADAQLTAQLFESLSSRVMSAILLSTENFNKIAERNPDITRELFDEWKDAEKINNETYYLFDRYVSPEGELYNHWLGVTSQTIQSYGLVYDAESIKTDWTEVKHPEKEADK